MKLLLLYGLHCDEKIWNPILPLLEEYTIELAIYPKDVTKHVNTPWDLTKWVYDTTPKKMKRSLP